MLDLIMSCPFISDFLEQNFIVQFFTAFTLLFFFFAFVIWIKGVSLRWKKRGGIWKVAGFILLLVFGVFFLVADAGFNIIYLPMLYLERANAHGEGWLVTSRLQYHKAQPGMYWQKKVSLFVCDRFVEKVDPGHCTTSRFR